MRSQDSRRSQAGVTEGAATPTNWGSFLAQALINETARAKPLKALHLPDAQAERAKLPESLRQGDGGRCGALSLSLLQQSFAKEIYFKTESGNMYCITTSEDGQWACFNARKGTGHYFNEEDFTSKKVLEVGRPANFAGYATGKVTEISYTNADNSPLKSEFMKLRSEAEG